MAVQFFALFAKRKTNKSPRRCTMDVVENAENTPQEVENAPQEVQQPTIEAAAEAVAEVVAESPVEAEVAAIETTDAEVPAVTGKTLADLHPKMELAGKVTKIALFGAFVDVGIGVDGLVHISQLNVDDVKNVSDVVNEGDEVTVWVRKIDTENGRLDLTMRKPLGMSWGEIKEGSMVTGKVIRIEKFGVFVEIGAERPGMIHVSELSNDYVNSPEDIVKMGDDIQARVLKVNRKKKQIDLSRKALEAPMAVAVVEDDSDDSAAMTAMELALRSAMRGTEIGAEYAASKQSKKDKKSAEDKRRREQEEIMTRTLRNRVK
jgi:ribosomal protein S1